MICIIKLVSNIYCYKEGIILLHIVFAMSTCVEIEVTVINVNNCLLQ